MQRDQCAKLGIAGVNTRPLGRACMAVAGNLSSTIRPVVRRTLHEGKAVGPPGLGDQAAGAWERACYLLDASFLACPGPDGGARWRAWANETLAPEKRRLPLYLDSGAFRRKQGTAPDWFTLEWYLRAIDLVRPDGHMAVDVWADAKSTLANYERMLAEGYGVGLIPVWQMAQSWDDRAGNLLPRRMQASAAVRAAVANARIAVHDPLMRRYAARHRLIAIGGMVKGPCPREVRHAYLAELCRLMPDHQFWGLGQASRPVVNGLGTEGLLDRVWLDGSWWIHDSRDERIVVVQDGLLRSIVLTHTGAQGFFTMGERLASHLRSLHGAYLGLWNFPGPPTIPTDMQDVDAVLELRRRLRPVQADLFDLLPEVSD